MVVMMFGYGDGWPAWGIALMWIGMTAFLAFLIWAAYALITSTSRRRLRDLIGSGRNDSPSGAGGTRQLYPHWV
jgi:hypothetical protein